MWRRSTLAPLLVETAVSAFPGGVSGWSRAAGVRTLSGAWPRFALCPGSEPGLEPDGGCVYDWCRKPLPAVTMDAAPAVAAERQVPPGADPEGGGPGLPLSPARGRRSGPLPLRPRGGFGGYLHELRRERGLTVRHLAATAGVHHTYVSKLERGDRQAPDEPVVEALARALQATPAQLDQLRWRAGLAPAGTGAPGQDDPTLTLVAEALGSGALSSTGRDRLRQAIAQAVQQSEPVAGPHADQLPGGAPPVSGGPQAGLPAAGLPPAGFPPPGQPGWPQAGWPQGGLPPAPQVPPCRCPR